MDIVNVRGIHPNPKSMRNIQRTTLCTNTRRTLSCALVKTCMVREVPSDKKSNQCVEIQLQVWRIKGECFGFSKRKFCESIFSSSHSSPPSSDVYTRHSSESDNPHRVSPVESNNSSLNNNNNYKTDHNHTYKTAPQNNLLATPNNFNVPVFVLHAKGSFYVPITIDYKTLLPFLHNYDLLEVVPNLHNIILHPVTINVNFQPHFNVGGGGQQQKVVVVNGNGGGYKAENGWWSGWGRGAWFNG